MRFTAAGVAALLDTGDGSRLEQVAFALRAAEDAQLVACDDDAGTPGERSFGFAHACVQEAAYASLPDADRRAAHRAAGRWLAAQGGTDASVLAWHFERAGESQEAVGFYRRAARAALAGRDVERAARLCEKALACAPEGEDVAALWLLRAEAAFMRGEIADGKDSAVRALELAQPGSLTWVRAAGLRITSAGQRGDNAEVAAVAEQVRAQAAEPDAAGPRAASLARAALQLCAAGQRDAARTLGAEAEQGAGAQEPDARAWLGRLRGHFHLLDHDYERAIDTFGEVIADHTAAGDVRSACQARIHRASLRVFAADFDAALGDLDVADAMARRTGADYFVAWAGYARGKVLVHTADPEAVRAHFDTVRRALAANPRIIAGIHVHLALAALRAGDAARAESDALAALAAHDVAGVRAPALGALAIARVRLGRVDDAREAARDSAAALRSVGSLEENEAVVHLAQVEAALAAGDEDEAREAARAASARLVSIARRLATPVRRERFLHAVEVHARTLRLAHRLEVAPARDD